MSAWTSGDDYPTPPKTQMVYVLKLCKSCVYESAMQDKTSFSNGVMTIRMDGNSGARLYYPVAMEYGMVEVTAKVSGVSGVVSAFYVRRQQ